MTDSTHTLRERARARASALGFDVSSLPIIGGLLLLLAVGGIILWLVDSSQRQSRIVFDVSEIQRTTSRVYRAVLAAESGQRGYLLTNDAAYLEAYRLGVTAFEPALTGLLTAVRKDPLQATDAVAIKAAGEAKMAELARTVAQQREGKGAEALDVVKTDLGRNLMVDIRNAVDRIQARATQSIDSEYQQGQHVDAALLVVTLIALGGILILGAVAVRLNSRAVLDAENSRAKAEALNDSLEAAVAERTIELTESNEEIQRFAYIVSHDLRSPLVNVMGFTSELQALKDDLLSVGDKKSDNADRVRIVREFDESIGFIKAAIDKMEGLIAAILRLSREGKRNFQSEPIDTTKLMEGLADAQRHQADEAGATVLIDKKLPGLVSDRVALEQIFGNLIDNAIKYLEPSRPGRIDVSGETIGLRARISVKDNGRGIAERDHKRVFELFRRSGEQNKPGHGIGLAHVQTLVRSLGGRITVASELGTGTTFTVVLPLAPTNTASHQKY